MDVRRKFVTIEEQISRSDQMSLYYLLKISGGHPSAADFRSCANIGLTSVWLASRLPRKKLVAVEPVTSNETLARRT